MSQNTPIMKRRFAILLVAISTLLLPLSGAATSTPWEAVLQGQSQGTQYPVFEPNRFNPAEYKARRERLMKDMGPGSLGVFFTNPTRNRNNDVDFLFRGDSNFIYLTGFEEPDAALILCPDGFEYGGKRAREALLVNMPDAGSLTWLGYRMGPDGVKSILGIEQAAPNQEFGAVLKAASEGASAKRLTTGLIPGDADGTLGRMVRQFTDWKGSAGYQQGLAGSQTVSRYRQIKSEWEIGLLRKCAQISAKAHAEAMRSMAPGMREYEIGALVGYIFAKEGCDYTGYPSICGSGANSTILHYNSNRRLMASGDIFCMDAAGEYFNYSADITRTFPVNGKFTPEQKAIYNIVLAAQEMGISMCRSGVTMGQIEQEIRKVLSDGLIELGIIKSSGELGRYYMHGFGHGIGLDVHDPVPGTLAPGAVLTVEPGIYIKEGSPCDRRYWNIGVRIEDDILVTSGSPENLSIDVPRRVEDIERLMAEPGIGNVGIKQWKPSGT